MDKLSLLLKKLNKLEYYDKVKNSYKTKIGRNGELIAVDLIGLHIEYLDVSIFEDFSEIEKLYLAWNKIEEIPVGIFDPLANLLHLDLSGNLIKSLNSGVFSGLILLKNLQLNDNHLSFIEDELFHPLRSISELNLRNNMIAVLKLIHIQKLISLEKFYLYFNPLPEDFADKDYWDKEAVDELKISIYEFYTKL